MRICVVGLGLIGGSMCMALRRAGEKADGYNRSEKALSFALKNKIIDRAATDFLNYDVVIVALPPKATVDFITSTKFAPDAIVSDICGVKKLIEDEVYSANLPIRYVGLHPMAGKEVSGIENACEDLFDRASMVITHGARTDKAAVETLKKLTKDMGFKRIVECSAEVHDKKIAYTSQLAHIVSNCYVKDKTVESCLGFTGGSFQDMTRIAGVDEKLWSELYLANAANLSQNIDLLAANLSDISKALKAGDKQALEELLRIGREQFVSGKANSFSDGQIKTTLLHE